MVVGLSAAGAASGFSDWRNGRAHRRACGCCCREAATTPAPCGWVGRPTRRLAWCRSACGRLAVRGAKPAKMRAVRAYLAWTWGASVQDAAPRVPGGSRRARTGGSSRHDRPAGAGVAGAPLGRAEADRRGHEGRGEPTTRIRDTAPKGCRPSRPAGLPVPDSGRWGACPGPQRRSRLARSRA